MIERRKERGGAVKLKMKMQSQSSASAYLFEIVEIVSQETVWVLWPVDAQLDDALFQRLLDVMFLDIGLHLLQTEFFFRASTRHFSQVLLRGRTHAKLPKGCTAASLCCYETLDWLDSV